MEVYSPEEQRVIERFPDGTGRIQWEDWRWQMRHSVTDIETVETLLGIAFSLEQKERLNRTVERFPFRTTPYYLSLIDTTDYEHDPVFRQCFPSEEELLTEAFEMNDPLSEEEDSPVPGITHRYPDRVLFLVSNVCAMYCRHCTRKRKVGDTDHIPDEATLLEGINYIRTHERIRDVLLSGGDPFLLPDDRLDWLLGELQEIPHVEVIRIGTRVPVVLPQRVTDQLADMLRGHHPLWINTQFNHPREITPSAQKALATLADAGIPLGNQSVLLAGVNDCPMVMRDLVQRLVQHRVRPYYLYQCDLSEGLAHFRTSVGRGIEIMESLIGHTSGFAVPTYVIDAPGGGGKIPVMPGYVISRSSNRVVLRNYEGVITTYREPDHYHPPTCGDCSTCTLRGCDTLPCEPTGVQKLLSDRDETISLVPVDLERMERRSNG